jgi:hypothetical protein
MNMADAQTPMQKHLRKYVEDGIQQKVRLSNMVLAYKAQEVKSRERTIDETTLLGQAQGKGIPQEKVALIEERRDRDHDILRRVQKVLGDAKSEMEGVTLRMNVHLEELSDIEIAIGGFVTHSIGVDSKASLDKETMIVTFENEGHIEIPIGVRMNKWKDSSQLTINKIKKAGV